MGKKGLPPAKRAPAEKKALSYAKDRRNTFGDNKKAARKSIPLRKAAGRRAFRHLADGLTAKLTEMSEAEADVAESSVRRAVVRKGREWKKFPDQPLGERVRNRLVVRKSHDDEV